MIATFDEYSSTTTYQQLIGTLQVSEGSHKLRLQAAIASPATTVEIDRIEVKGRAPKLAKWYRSTTTTGAQTTTYTHDSLGRRTSVKDSAETINYSWTGQRLTKVTSAHVQSTYTYDGQGQRTKKVVKDIDRNVTTTTSYTYAGTQLLALDATVGSATQSLTYLYADKDTPIGALYKPAGTATPVSFEIISDLRADVRELRDSSGNAFARYDYDAYGNITGEQLFSTALISGALAQAITDIQPLRYAGYVLDPESGLYYCSQRYFDPDTGAFISKDPAKADGELSAYSYCGTDPINNVDPTGLIFTSPSEAALVKAIQVQAAEKQALKVAEAAANAALKSGKQTVNCAGHKLKKRDDIYVCINCGGFFDAHGKLVGATIPSGLDDNGTEDMWKAWVALAVALTAGTGAWAIGAYGVGGAAATAATGAPAAQKVADKAATVASSNIDPNHLNHIFGNPGHLLDGYLTTFGGNQSMAAQALDTAAQKVVTANGLTGVVQPFTVQVNGYNVTVAGKVIDGTLNIGTAYIPRP